MSGHSKWANIKIRKGKIDKVRGNTFTKLSKNITVAAKELGGDLAINFKLRVAIDKAKKANMPKDNIEKAVKKGTGELSGEIYEEYVYGGFGPGGSAILIESVTDNKNRSSQHIKILLSKAGGSLGNVMWKFDRRGVITINKEDVPINNEEVELLFIENDVIDYELSADGVVVIVQLEVINSFNKILEKAGFKNIEIVIEYIAKEKIDLNGEHKEKLEKLIELLENDDDVNDVFTDVN